MLQSHSTAVADVDPTVKQTKFNWGKLSKAEILSFYTVCVEAELSSLLIPIPDQLALTPSPIDSHMEMITRTLLTAVSDHIPTKKYFHT